MACGVALVLTHRQRVLFGKRVTGSRRFEWQLPGGWMVAGETPRAAALRELHEETGLGAGEPRFVGLTSNLFAAGQHSISLYFEAECANPVQLRRAEPGNCLAWEWLDWDEVGENLYLPLRLLKQTGYSPFSGPLPGTFVSI